jgi:hypothetical protein
LDLLDHDDERSRRAAHRVLKSTSRQRREPSRDP